MDSEGKTGRETNENARADSLPAEAIAQERRDRIERGANEKTRRLIWLHGGWKKVQGRVR